MFRIWPGHRLITEDVRAPTHPLLAVPGTFFEVGYVNILPHLSQFITHCRPITPHRVT
jgi:hypothetical protein